jgi:phosphoribosyl 1,2-cyclic phosphate phosphodiesterase
MSLKLTLLGTGSSSGVPRVGRVWGACDPANPKNRRRRCALLVDRFAKGGRTTVLVDTPTDMREQLLDAGVETLDGVLFTHDHADHTHGIDDLRGLFIHKRRRIDVYSDERTSAMLTNRFGYCFVKPQGSDYPPIVNDHRIGPGKPIAIDGPGGTITAMPFLQDHGDIPSLGFRFGGLAYSADLKTLPDDSVPALAGLDLWIVDALRYTPHPSHFSVEDALGWIARIKPKRAILTNLHSDLDYETLRAELPPHIEPAYDGLTVSLPH